MGSQLSNYDFIFGSIIIASAVLSIFRGGVSELLSLSTWFIALFVMRNYGLLISKIIPEIISNQLLRSLLSYIIAFIAVAVVITIVKLIFHKVIHSFGLSGLNYLIGAIFGIIRGIIVCALVVLVIEMLHNDATHGWQKSWFSPIISPTVTIIVQAIPPEFKNINSQIGQTVSDNAVKLLGRESSQLVK